MFGIVYVLRCVAFVAFDDVVVWLRQVHSHDVRTPTAEASPAESTSTSTSSTSSRRRETTKSKNKKKAKNDHWRRRWWWLNIRQFHSCVLALYQRPCYVPPLPLFFSNKSEEQKNIEIFLILGSASFTFPANDVRPRAIRSDSPQLKMEIMWQYSSPSLIQKKKIY